MPPFLTIFLFQGFFTEWILEVNLGLWRWLMWWSPGHASMRIWVWSPAPTPRSQPWWYTLVNLSTGQPDTEWSPRLTSYCLPESVWAPGFMRYFVLKNKVESNWAKHLMLTFDLQKHVYPRLLCTYVHIHVHIHKHSHSEELCCFLLLQPTDLSVLVLLGKAIHSQHIFPSG